MTAIICSKGETTVTFAEKDGQTTLTVTSYAVGLVPIAPQMLAGMEAGWTQSIDKLETLLGGSGQAGTTT
jgi:hypothetical protein